MHVLISAVSSARQPSGICRYAANLSLALAHAVSKVTLVIASWQAGYFHRAFDLQHRNLAIVRVQIRKNACSRNLWYFGALPRLARQHRADIVQFGFPAPLAKHRFSCPVVTCIHDLYPYDIPRNFGVCRALFNRLFLQQCVKASSHLVCSSDWTLRRLSTIFPESRSRCTRIYQSIRPEPSMLLPPPVPCLGGHPYILMVAQHRSNKNIDLVLQAFAQLQRSRTDRKLLLLIVGADGPETRSLKSLVQRLSLHSSVMFIAGLRDVELGWLYRTCEALVVASSIEGFCLPVAEALAFGCRVLCSDIPVLREVGGPSCQYFDLSNNDVVATLAHSMQDILDSPSHQPVGLERFSPSVIARQYTDLYSKVLQGQAIDTTHTSEYDDAAQQYVS